MLHKDINKELVSRALEVENLLAERKYEDLAFHLTYFEKAEVTSGILQGTDIVRVVYRVLKTCPRGALKLKAKVLLSKWKKLYRKCCHETSCICEHCSKICENKEGPEKLAVDIQDQVHNSEQKILINKSTSSPSSYKFNLNKSDSSAQDCYGNHEESVTDHEVPKKVNAEDLALRTKCTELLYQALREDSECQEKLQNLAKAIEENIYKIHAGNTKKYRNCIRSKISNLKNPKNSHLKMQILSRALSPKVFAEMGVMEMACDELRNLRANYTETCVQEHQLPQGVDGVHTNKIRCRRCDKFNCTVTMISRGTLFLPGWVRTGNPDEEMMTFVICNECGEQWYHNRWVCL
ncbi:transcription elongation factor A N-terminal and central domain-containing protein isoform X1 [Xenopus tropicalis]|uniref:LOC100145741 protein n=1 Tax=Xenopus tropicalis TaxID=8364 RepID=B1WB26_XENTR|nr:transcription elongation factor A N-terminal and central domain-containing protein [Xenopus tropicalis]XP_031751568.1 transcription elongation factor A N-terminal and central domain-containing protein isoform X1 [Xenopus tropicalis]AAI61589.1 LOC100145741 protein [Xenopus tropicalis]|eukprot:NP_001120586.1 transcription elongation factor A N-terminal and central domain-containing protein [Xenopus tropicalis]